MSKNLALFIVLPENGKAHESEPIKEQCARLKAAFLNSGLPVTVIAADRISGGVPQLNSLVASTPVICGEGLQISFAILLETLQTRNNSNAIVVTDALSLTDSPLSPLLEHLDSTYIQLSPTEAVLSLLELGGRFVYSYAKVDMSTSVVVFFERGKKVLLIKRKFAPHKDCYAFPSGFLRPLVEDLPACAARELMEETGLRFQPGELQFINVRSNPGRDPRGHIIDAGYWKLVTKQEEVAVLKQLKAGDDAAEVALHDLSNAVTLPLAADHGTLLIDACSALSRSHFERDPNSSLINLPAITQLVTGIRQKLVPSQ